MMMLFHLDTKGVHDDVLQADCPPSHALFRRDVRTENISCIFTIIMIIMIIIVIIIMTIIMSVMTSTWVC